MRCEVAYKRTSRTGPVGPASPSGAMLRLLRLDIFCPSRVENSRNPAGGVAMLISPVFFIVRERRHARGGAFLRIELAMMQIRRSACPTQAGVHR